MPEGIMILSESTNNPMLIGIGCLILSSIAFISCLVLLTVSITHSNTFESVFASIFLVISTLLIFTSVKDGIKGEPKTTYKVLIDESVSFTDICEKYSIISQDGQIYTIQEK